MPVLAPAVASPLPPLYAKWIADVLDGPLPEERHATCMDCAMCKPPEKAGTGHLVQFDPRSKCCTYVPILPNFLVGQILLDESPDNADGRASVALRIAEGVGVSPLGLMPSPEYSLIYKYTGTETFGRASGLRCPHYVDHAGGLCGIWKHRNAVCATWFCKFERGARGRLLWIALRELLSTVERHLALWCVYKLTGSLEMLGSALLPYFAVVSPEGFNSAHGRPPALGDLDDFWGRTGRSDPASFFIEGAGLVGDLGWHDVLASCGPDVALRARSLQVAYDALSGVSTSGCLRLVSTQSIPQGDDDCSVAGYSEYDTVVMPRSLLGALALFDGTQPTKDVRRGIGARTSVTLDPDQVQRLVDFGILAPNHSTLERQACE